MTPSSIQSSRSSLQVPDPDEVPPPYSADEAAGAGTVYSQWRSLDPRASSTQSLAPSVEDLDADPRRTLLIVYIHGFMGNDSSFRSFPAHVHNYLRVTLEDTHVIHSKIYPRYKTYKAIGVARDNFSKWLEPHESPTTDVILIGHSMGGLLAAEIVLSPAQDARSGYPFKHHILGTLSLDSPFLGLHPGIIVSGIASLFHKSPQPLQDDPQPDGEFLAAASSQDLSGRLSPDPSIYSELMPQSGVTSPTLGSAISPTSSAQLRPDPFFNPPFFNDVLFKDRGWWKNVAHFATKHKPEGLVTAARTHILNHLEFGACLMDYVALNQRYDKLRHLEDVDDYDTSSGRGGPPAPRREARVRFVNYFTLSTGRKRSRSRSSGRRSAQNSRRGSGVHLRPEAASAPASQRSSLDIDSGISTPRISIEDHSDGSMVEVLQMVDPEPMPESDDESSKEELARIPEVPNEDSVPEHSHEASGSGKGSGDAPQTAEDKAQDSALPEPSVKQETLGGMTLPAIPDLPERPQPPNLDGFTDKDARKQAEREGKRAQKSYEQAVKNREKAIKEREKLVQKQQKKEQKDAEKQAKMEEKKRAQDEAASKMTQAEGEQLRLQQEALRMENEARRMRGEPPLEPEEADLQKEADELERRLHQQQQRQEQAVAPPKKEKPQKERKFCTLPRKVNGARDPFWVGIHIEGMDEVGAHCGLFFAGPHYEKLIGDVGSRIEDWVHEDASKRAILALR